MFIQPVSVFVINAYFLGLNMVALRVVVERKIPMIQQLLWIGTVPGTRIDRDYVQYCEAEIINNKVIRDRSI